MRVVSILLFFGIVASCAIIKNSVEINLRPIPVAEFLNAPFGHDESIDSFNKHLPPKTKIKKLIKRSAHKHHRPDTIYSFNYKKSRIAIYKTQHNQESLLGGSFVNPEIELTNGIRVGMLREQFFSSFIDLDFTSKDTIQLKKKPQGKRFNFIFNQKNRLEKFSFVVE